MRLGAAVRPRGERVLGEPLRLRGDGRDGVGRSDDDVARERAGHRLAAERQPQARRVGVERERDGARVEAPRDSALEALGVGRREAQLEVGRILRLRGGERARRDSRRGLDEASSRRRPTARTARGRAARPTRSREWRTRRRRPRSRRRRSSRRPSRWCRQPASGWVRGRCEPALIATVVTSVTPPFVRDPQPDVVGPRTGVVGRGRRDGGRVAEGPIPVQVPLVLGDGAVRVARPRPVEADGQRQRPAGRRGRGDRPRRLSCLRVDEPPRPARADAHVGDDVVGELAQLRLAEPRSRTGSRRRRRPRRRWRR